MNLTKNGVTIIVDDAEIVRMALDRLNGGAAPATLQGIAVPRIGEYWAGQGGVYAGVARGRDGARDYHLILGPELDGSNDWEKSVEWTKSLEVDGHRDFTLPSRKEQALLFANLSDHFQPECYWSGEQHASDSNYAWLQDFDYGTQGYWVKDYELRARAVRRLIIQ